MGHSNSSAWTEQRKQKLLEQLGVPAQQFTRIKQYSFYRHNKKYLPENPRPTHVIPYTLPLIGLSWSILRHNPDEMIIIGDLEKQLLQIYRSIGGKIVFNSQISRFDGQSADIDNIQRHTIEETPYSLIINTEGSHSELNSKIGAPQKTNESWTTLYISGEFRGPSLTPEIRYLLKGDRDRDFLSTFFLTNGRRFSAGIDTLHTPLGDHDIDLHYQLAGIGINANEIKDLKMQTISIRQGSLDHFYYPKLKVAVIGDAAHSVNPLTAYGINLAFDEAQSIAGLLNREGELTPSAIKAFEEKMRKNVHASNANHQRYSTQVPLMTHKPRFLVDPVLRFVSKLSSCRLFLSKK